MLLPFGGLSAQDTLQRRITFRYQNDFFSATDRYLTQEVTFRYQTPFVTGIPSARLLLRMEGSSVQGDLFVRQQCYTPRSIRRDTIFTGERPFAAALFIGQEQVGTDAERGLRLTSSLRLGVLGPCALCAEEQRGIHRALDNIEPLGWQFQVAGAPILNYAVRIDKRLWKRGWTELSGGLQGELGTYRTNGLVSARFEVGRFRSPFATAIVLDRRFRFSVAFTGEVKAVAHDATMQGGLFDAASVYVLPASALERVVLRGGWEAKLSFKRTALSFNKVHLTREFKGGLAHGWGGFTLDVWL
ncbi:MAG TPA: lipid A-modifier LpxR family protein [Flavobacteriales bacterium]